MTGDQVPVQINPQEAYELTEVKIRKHKFVKLPYIPKKVDFFSLAGKTRLVRIWNDNSLSDEIMFTGGDVGPSDAFVREQVSDFVQHYILKRARRLSSDKQTLYSQLSEMQKSNKRKGPQVYSTYEKYIKERNEYVDRSRSLLEVERVKQLQLSGQTKVSPPDEVLQNPVYRVKRLLDKLRILDKQEYDIKVHPLSIDIYSNEKIKILHEQSLRNEKKGSIYHNSEESPDVPSEPLTGATTTASSPSCTLVTQSRSSSSGFHDMTMTSPVSRPGSKLPYNPASTSVSSTSRSVSYRSCSRRSEVGALHFISMVSDASDEDTSLISQDSVC